MTYPRLLVPSLPSYLTTLLQFLIGIQRKVLSKFQYSKLTAFPTKVSDGPYVRTIEVPRVIDILSEKDVLVTSH